MKCDIVIISFNTKELVHNCIDTAFATSQNLINRIIVVDNASSDGTIQYIKKLFPNVITIENKVNYGYAYAVNQGVAECKSEIVVIANSDIIFTEGALEILINELTKDANCALTFPRLVYPDGRYQYSYGELPSAKSALSEILLIKSFENHLRKYLFNKFDLDLPKWNFGYADGALLVVRKSVFDKIGGFDIDFPFYSEDMDFSYRVRAHGYKIKFCRKARIIHIRGGSSNPNKFSYETTERLLRSKVIFARKHLKPYSFKFYARAQIFKSKLILLISNVIEKVINKNFANIEFHLNNSKIWKEILNEMKH